MAVQTDPTMKLPEVLRLLEMSRAAFYRMRARGKGPRVYKLPNGQLRFKRTEFWEWFEGHAEEVGQ